MVDNRGAQHAVYRGREEIVSQLCNSIDDAENIIVQRDDKKKLSFSIESQAI